MGFRIVTLAEVPAISVDSFTSQMIGDLITFYAMDMPSENVECRVPAHLGIAVMNYPILSRNLIDDFYHQLDILNEVIRDIIIGDYHIDSVFDPTGNYSIWGEPIQDLADLKFWTFEICKRDFNEQGEWLYTISQGDFETLRPFFDQCVDLFIANNDHGSFDEAVANVRLANINSDNPFSHD